MYVGKVGDGEGGVKNIDTNLHVLCQDTNQDNKAEWVRDKSLSEDPESKVLYKQENVISNSKHSC